MKNSSTKIFLARHGRSEWNGKKRVSGQMNPMLSEHGQQQAKALAEVLKNEALSAVYTSTLDRSIETAKPASLEHKINPVKETALMEMNLGILQGRFRDQRDPEAERLWKARTADRLNYRIPGGETFLELEARVIPCLNTLLEKEAGGVILIVGHRNTNRVILKVLMAWSSENVADLKLRNKYLYEITLGQHPRIQTISLNEKKQGLKYDGFKA